MKIQQAIIKYLSLPNQGVLDEGVFYNVLKDLQAFEQIPASQHIVRAFVTKGYLKDIWRGKKGWQLQSRHYLIEALGFQEDKVDIVINEISKGFKNFTPMDISRDQRNQAPTTLPDTSKFKRYEPEELKMPHPFKPDDFNIHIGDIIMAKNGIAQIKSVRESYIEVRYIKQNADKNCRIIYYDENIEYIITPKDNIFLKAENGKILYIHKCQVDDCNARCIGTYADCIRRVILTPYTLKIKKFKICSEAEFLANCIDISAFEDFKTTED